MAMPVSRAEIGNHVMVEAASKRRIEYGGADFASIFHRRN